MSWAFPKRSIRRWYHMGGPPSALEHEHVSEKDVQSSGGAARRQEESKGQGLIASEESGLEHFDKLTAGERR